MKLKGTIQSSPSIVSGGVKCAGTTEVAKERFLIRIADECFDDDENFQDVMLHELLHLWLFIVDNRGGRVTKFSERRHHRIINPIVDFALKRGRKNGKR